METLNTSLWNGLQKGLYNFTYKKVKDSDAAKDIVQDVFIKAQAKIDQLREPEKLTGWIYQIARHTITDYFRSNNKQLNAHELDWENDAHDFNDCVADCLKKLIVTLPEKYRQAIELAELGNISQTEFSERLGISYSGVKSRVQRARKMLREKMEELFIIETDAYGNVMVCENKAPCGCESTTERGEVVTQNGCATTSFPVN
jgi:RNA polymerase sigma-70 factor (ECF subfamily)